MDLRGAMHRAALKGALALGPEADKVRAFLANLHTPTGGYRGRSEQEDLYYTVFAVESLLALGAPLPSTLYAFLEGFDDGQTLDLIHFSCLTRCWKIISAPVLDQARHERMAARLEAFRAQDGGFHPDPGSPLSSAYGCFLGEGIAQDLGVRGLDQGQAKALFERFRSADGGFANEPGLPAGITPITAGILALRQAWGWPACGRAEKWLEARCLAEGGFQVAPVIPFPDLLSTATALHALRPLETGREEIALACRPFLRSCFNPQAGSFFGQAFDPIPDAEYTWYGLLALGQAGWGGPP